MPNFVCILSLEIRVVAKLKVGKKSATLSQWWKKGVHHSESVHWEGPRLLLRMLLPELYCAK